MEFQDDIVRLFGKRKLHKAIYVLSTETFFIIIVQKVEWFLFNFFFFINNSTIVLLSKF